MLGNNAKLSEVHWTEIQKHEFRRCLVGRKGIQ